MKKLLDPLMGKWKNYSSEISSR